MFIYTLREDVRNTEYIPLYTVKRGDKERCSFTSIMFKYFGDSIRILTVSNSEISVMEKIAQK